MTANQNMIPALGDSDPADKTYVDVQRSGDSLTVRWRLTNSKTADGRLGPPWHIDGSFTWGANGSGHNVRLVADRYPAYEFFRYPTYTQLGKFVAVWMGYRPQTNITDLNQPTSYQTVCGSTGPWPEDRAPECPWW